MTPWGRASHQIFAGLVELRQPLQKVGVEHRPFRQLRVHLVEEHHAPVHLLQKRLSIESALVGRPRLLEPAHRKPKKIYNFPFYLT